MLKKGLSLFLNLQFFLGFVIKIFIFKFTKFFRIFYKKSLKNCLKNDAKYLHSRGRNLEIKLWKTDELDSWT